MRFNRGQLRRRRPAYLPFVGSLESRVVLSINTLVLEFAQAHLGEQVGSGQCADLASEALRVAGADFAVDDPGNGDYIWGTLIATITPGNDSNPTVPCVPGDIIQYQNVTLADGSTAAHHTSIVAAVNANRRPTYVYEQNVNGNLTDVYDSSVINAQTVEQGTIHIYQPVPRVDSPGEVQFTVTNDTSNAQTVTLYENGTAEFSDSLNAYQTLGSYFYLWVTSNPPATWTIGVGGQQIPLNNAAGYEVDATSNGSSIQAVITSPVITWADPSAIVYGTPLSATQLDATASVPGMFSYAPALDTILDAGNNQPLSVTFMPTDTTDYTSATDTVYIEVENPNRSVPTITWANPGGITYGTPLGTNQLDATASVTGTFTYTPAAGTLLGAGVNQTLTVTFTPTDSTDYTGATATVTVNVDRAAPVVSVNPVELTYGTALANSQLGGTATWTVGGNVTTVLGSFTYASAAGTVPSAGAGLSESVTFTPTDSTDYTVVTATVALNVNPARLIVTANNQTKVYGAALPVLTASYSGFANGDTAGSLTTQPKLATTATASSAVSGSPYAITASGAVNRDYTISYVAGTLTLTPAPLTITANSAQRILGQANPPFSVKYSGFVLGQGPGVLSGTLKITTKAAASSPAGSYPIVPSGLTSSNYAFHNANGILTVIGPPKAVNDKYPVTENKTLFIPSPGVLSNDQPGNAGPLTAVLKSRPKHGTLTFNTNGSFVYTPSRNFTGTDQFTYFDTAMSGKLQSNIATVTLTVGASAAKAIPLVSTNPAPVQSLADVGAVLDRAIADHGKEGGPTRPSSEDSESAIDVLARAVLKNPTLAEDRRGWHPEEILGDVNRLARSWIGESGGSPSAMRPAPPTGSTAPGCSVQVLLLHEGLPG